MKNIYYINNIEPDIPIISPQISIELGIHFVDHRPGDLRAPGGHLLVHEAETFFGIYGTDLSYVAMLSLFVSEITFGCTDRIRFIRSSESFFVEFDNPKGV